MVKIERAIISVSDKEGIVDFSKKLVDRGVEIVSIKTYRRWQREELGGKEPGKVGNPGFPAGMILPAPEYL